MQRDEELFEMVRFLKDNMATRADLHLAMRSLEQRLSRKPDNQPQRLTKSSKPSNIVAISPT